MTYGQGPECQFLKSAFCPHLDFSFKLNSSVGIKKENVFHLKFCDFYAFSSVRMRKSDDLFKRK